MSAASLQKKIDNAHRKIGKKLGYAYKIYRPLNNVDVLDDANYIGTANTTTTLNDAYTKNMEFDVPIWTCYTDATQVQQGDFLYSEEENRTLLILIRRPLEPLLAVEVNDRCDITAVGYGNTGNGYGPLDGVYLAKNLPCFINYTEDKLNGKKSMPGRNTLANAGVRMANITTSLPNNVMVMNHTLEDQRGFRGSIVEYTYSSVGAGLIMRAVEYDAPTA